MRAFRQWTRFQHLRILFIWEPATFKIALLRNCGRTTVWCMCVYTYKHNIQHGDQNILLIAHGSVSEALLAESGRTTAAHLRCACRAVRGRRRTGSGCDVHWRMTSSVTCCWCSQCRCCFDRWWRIDPGAQVGTGWRWRPLKKKQVLDDAQHVRHIKTLTAAAAAIQRCLHAHVSYTSSGISHMTTRAVVAQQ